MNGDLRVAYRASREGERDIVFVSPWFTNCEVFTELPSIQGWIEAMTSLGRLIFFDHPGIGARSDAPGALPTLEQWADSITAVLDDLGSREAVLVAACRRVPGIGAVRSDTSIPHDRADRARGGSACRTRRGTRTRGAHCCRDRHVGHGGVAAFRESGHAVERGDPGNMGTA